MKDLVTLLAWSNFKRVTKISYLHVIQINSGKSVLAIDP